MCRFSTPVRKQPYSGVPPLTPTPFYFKMYCEKLSVKHFDRFDTKRGKIIQCANEYQTFTRFGAGFHGSVMFTLTFTVECLQQFITGSLFCFLNQCQLESGFQKLCPYDNSNKSHK